MPTKLTYLRSGLVGRVLISLVLLGISSGANCWAALEVAKKLGPSKVVLTVFCDTGERYLTTEVFQAEGI